MADFRDTPESDKSSGFGSGLLLYAACCAVAVFVGWPIIKGAFPDSFPAENGGAARYDAYGYTGDPDRFQRRQQGGHGGYSDFYPGPRIQRLEPQPGTEEGGWAASSGAVRRAPETYGSARSQSPQHQQQGQYRQQFHECRGAWWNPFSEAGCGSWQDSLPPSAGRR